MTVATTAPRVKAYLVQFLMLLSVNVPTVSFGLAMGWVSLASGESATDAERAGGAKDTASEDSALVGAAAATFAAGLLGVPLGARALQHARKPILAATSAAFAICWALTLAGGWWLVAGRVCAGAAGALAWCLAPLLGSEMCSSWKSAAAAAPVLAHNLGMVMMYLASHLRLQHRVVVLSCLALSVLHCGAALLGPESPAYLASKGRHEEAKASLAWLRGVHCEHPSLVDEVSSLPAPNHQPPALLRLVKEMLSDDRRRCAFTIVLIAVVGQEACGVLTLLQFAERVFILAGAGAGEGEGEEDSEEGRGRAPRRALVLGVVQLVAAAASLGLIERLPRRPLLVWCALITGGWLALGAGAVGAGSAAWSASVAALALGAAVAFDSLGLQPAPYALLHDMFHYQYRGCAVLLVMAAASVGNAAETLVFPAVVHAAGLQAALALASTITLLYALFVFIYVPETINRSIESIYDDICLDKNKLDEEAGKRKRSTALSDEKYNSIQNVDVDSERFKSRANFENKNNDKVLKTVSAASILPVLIEESVKTNCINALVENKDNDNIFKEYNKITFYVKNQLDNVLKIVQEKSDEDNIQNPKSSILSSDVSNSDIIIVCDEKNNDSDVNNVIQTNVQAAARNSSAGRYVEGIAAHVYDWSANQSTACAYTPHPAPANTQFLISAQ